MFLIFPERRCCTLYRFREVLLLHYCVGTLPSQLAKYTKSLHAGKDQSGMTMSTVKHLKNSSPVFSHWRTSSCGRLVGAGVCTRWTRPNSVLRPLTVDRFTFSCLDWHSALRSDGRLLKPIAHSDIEPCLQYQHVVHSFCICLNLHLSAHQMSAFVRWRSWN